MKIFINPGHGGNNLQERDVVLMIGKRVEGYLRAVDYDVKLFQYDGLDEICSASNKLTTKSQARFQSSIAVSRNRAFMF